MKEEFINKLNRETHLSNSEIEYLVANMGDLETAERIYNHDGIYALIAYYNESCMIKNYFDDTMTLNQAINHCYKNAEMKAGKHCKDNACVKEHLQLAHWLEELKIRREIAENENSPSKLYETKCRIYNLGKAMLEGLKKGLKV